MISIKFTMEREYCLRIDGRGVHQGRCSEDIRSATWHGFRDCLDSLIVVLRWLFRRRRQERATPATYVEASRGTVDRVNTRG